MPSQKTNPRLFTIVTIVFVAIAMRIVNTQVPALSNFTPVGAVALFGGVYFAKKWQAYAVPLLALFISDLVINYIYTSSLSFYASSFWMYGCFILMAFIGTLIKKVNFVNLAAASIISVLIHWLVMDLPIAYGLPTTWSNYSMLLLKAIYPFETNMLKADAIYGSILFGGFELAKSKYTFLENKKQLAL